MTSSSFSSFAFLICTVGVTPDVSFRSSEGFCLCSLRVGVTEEWWQLEALNISLECWLRHQDMNYWLTESGCKDTCWEEARQWQELEQFLPTVFHVCPRSQCKEQNKQKWDPISWLLHGIQSWKESILITYCWDLVYSSSKPLEYRKDYFSPFVFRGFKLLRFKSIWNSLRAAIPVPDAIIQFHPLQWPTSLLTAALSTFSEGLLRNVLITCLHQDMP